MVMDELQAAGVVTEVDDDLALTDSFREAWHAEIDRLQSRDREAYLASFFQVDREALRLETNPDDSVTVRRGRDRLGEWPSAAAIDVDVAAFLTLQDEFPEWAELTGTERDTLVARLRLFLETCPVCDESLAMEESATTPEGVPRVRCVDCATVFV